VAVYVEDVVSQVLLQYYLFAVASVFFGSKPVLQEQVLSDPRSVDSKSQTAAHWYFELTGTVDKSA